MNTLWQDVKHGARMLAKNPGLTAVVVVTLALAIGANTAIFSLVRAVLLRPLPFSHPERLVMVAERRPTSNDANIPVSAHEFAAWTEQNHSFEQTAIYDFDEQNLTGGGEPETMHTAIVSADYFSVLDVRPAAGRTFFPGEDLAGRNHIAVLSHGLWQRRFGSETGILGKSILLNNESYTVVGIMPSLPQTFQPDLWTPLDLPLQKQRVGQHSLYVVARLKAGVTLQQAQADLDVIARRLAQQLPEMNTDHNVKVIPLREALVGDVRRALWTLLAAVAFVLLIGCANVANLLLTRAAARQKEIAIRKALGAGRVQLIRHFLTESMLLALMGGAAGLLLALWITDLLPKIKALSIPLLDTTAVDGTVLSVTLGLSLFTGLASGLAPALRGSKPMVAKWLNEGTRLSAEPSRRRLRSVLVAAEVALALILSVGAGLMIKSFIKLVAVDPGFDPHNILVVNIFLPDPNYPQPFQRRRFFDQLLERIKVVPGVQSAGGTTNLPLNRSDNWMPFTVEGRPAPPPGQEPHAPFRVISPDYFRALRIPLRNGRTFSESDARISVPVIRWYASQRNPENFDQPQPAPVAIISESMARQYWPGEDPMGRRIRVLFSPWMTIVGVVGDVRHGSLDSPSYPHIYVPYTQEPWGFMTLVVRTSDNPKKFAGAVREQVRALDVSLPVGITVMDELFSDSVGIQRFYLSMLVAFGTVALLLAAVGILGVVSYAVTQRIREIGVRMALGARRADIVRLIITQNMAPTLFGVGIGAGGAFALTRLIKGLLYEVDPSDPLTFVAMCLLLAAVALVACYVPARRAAKVDPMVALRYE